ncbi:MAG: glycosyltransferase family 4 protein [Sedimentisphaerales bacterium]|nr:glycosyltransferase family 4 protein [Sedimentisphaerales bacterium]
MVAPKAYPVFNTSVEAVFGGAEVDIYFLATELAKDPDLAVTVIVGDYGQDALEMREAVQLVKGIDLSGSQSVAALQLWRALKLANSHVYMIKTISPGVPLVVAFCRVHRRAFVYRTSSGIEYDRAFFQDHPFTGWLFKRALRSADLVLAQTQQAADGLRRLSLAAVQVVPNAHRLDPLQTAQRDCVLWVGRSDAIKGPQIFIDLARRLPEQQFVMICQKATGDNAYENLVRRAKAIGNLEFIERVPFGQASCYFRRAKVLVNTSRSEGFPNTFIHAWAQAVPVLSLLVDPDSIISREGIGLCACGSIGRLVEGLRWILEDDRYIQMGLQARRYAERTHDIAKVIQIYKRLISGIVRSYDA